MKTKKAIFWVGFWMAMAAIFNIGIYLYFQNMSGNGHQKALEFFGGYVIELSLSLDNLFLFIVIFSAFGIETHFQKRVLNYGIIGAIILRLIFIFGGVQVVNAFHWILGVFGIILFVSGVKILFTNEEKSDYKDSKVLKLLGKIVPITEKLEGQKFFVKRNKVLYATPLFAILVLVEFSDLIFAIDSIPAIFSITTDSFIVYTSNIFAIMGLRNMYFLLEKIHKAFIFVKYGVATILAFTGVKLLLAAPFKFEVAGYYIHTPEYEISTVLSVAIILSIVLVSILASVVFKPKEV